MPFKYPSVRERLEANSIPLPWCGCRIWLGATRQHRRGEYGKLNIRVRTRYRERMGSWKSDRDGQKKIKSVSAHRVSLADALGVPLWKLREAAHAPGCCSTLCIEPMHLRSATRRQNEADKRASERGKP